MINVITVKWGTKYSSEDVNNVYKMVKKNLDLPFEFYCFTEDADGLDKDIKVIENTLEYDLDGVWNKLLLFKEDLMPKGIKLYLDIDIVIQNSINNILSYMHPGLTKIKCFWKSIEYTDGTPERRDERWDMNYNSSVMLWEDNLNHIWEHFIEDPDMFMLKYAGMDRFIFHEGFKANHFPEGFIYSRIFGKDLTSKKEYTDLIDRGGGRLEWAYHFPEFPICIFNGPVVEEHYKGFEKYFT